MSYETKILILTFAGSILLAAGYLYVQDLLYMKATGRPGSALLLQAYMAVWSGEYKGWSKLIPLGWMISGGVPFYHLQKRWRKQQAELNDQPSGAARK
jgi:hypothetical protein